MSLLWLTLCTHSPDPLCTVLCVCRSLRSLCRVLCCWRSTWRHQTCRTSGQQLTAARTQLNKVGLQCHDAAATAVAAGDVMSCHLPACYVAASPCLVCLPCDLLHARLGWTGLLHVLYSIVPIQLVLTRLQAAQLLWHAVPGFQDAIREHVQHCTCLTCSHADSHTHFAVVLLRLAVVSCSAWLPGCHVREHVLLSVAPV